jgi:hypothetical protein
MRVLFRKVFQRPAVRRFLLPFTVALVLVGLAGLVAMT